MPIKAFRAYSDATEANIVLGKLQANGVPCFLTNEHTNGLLWHMSIAIGGIQLMLHDNDFDRALEILSEEPTPITNEERGTVRCPNCGSNNVKFGPKTRSKYGVWGLIASLVFVVPAPVVRKGFHCFYCELDFQTEA